MPGWSDHENPDRLSPRASGEFIASRAKHITIDQDGIKKAATLIVEDSAKNEALRTGWRDQPVHPNGTDKFMIEWCFLVDTMNFCFWPNQPDEPAFSVTWKDNKYTGYYSLCACVNRAIEQGTALTDPKCFGSLTLDSLTKILTGDDGIVMPLIPTRLEILHDTARVLQDQFEGSFVNCLNQANHSAQSLLSLVTKHFASYRDYGTYGGQPVSFLKRGQILIADLNSCLTTDETKPYFTDIDTLTMFADYRVPQALYYVGALKYSDDLKECLSKHPKLGYLEIGDSNVSREQEYEIRGTSIRACQLIRQCIVKEHPDQAHKFTEASVDYFLWCYRRKYPTEIEATIPFHKTRSIFY